MSGAVLSTKSANCPGISCITLICIYQGPYSQQIAHTVNDGLFPITQGSHCQQNAHSVQKLAVSDYSVYVRGRVLSTNNAGTVKNRLYHITLYMSGAVRTINVYRAHCSGIGCIRQESHCQQITPTVNELPVSRYTLYTSGVALSTNRDISFLPSSRTVLSIKW